MRELIFGLILGTAFSFIVSKLKKENDSHSGAINGLYSFNNIGTGLKLSERYKLYRQPYKELPLVNESADKRKQHTKIFF